MGEDFNKKLARLDDGLATLAKRMDAHLTRRADADFKEGDHPRAGDGKFGSGGGGKSASKGSDKSEPVALKKSEKTHVSSMKETIGTPHFSYDMKLVAQRAKTHPDQVIEIARQVTGKKASDWKEAVGNLWAEDKSRKQARDGSKPAKAQFVK